MKTIKQMTWMLAVAGLLVQNTTATIVTINDNRDTTILKIVPDNNYGAYTYMSAGYQGGGNNPQKSLVGFNLSALAGEYAAINSITLRLYYDGYVAADFSGLTSLNNEVYEISAANGNWPEGTGSGGVMDATWNNKDADTGPISWAGSAGLSTPATDYVTTLLSSVTFNTISLPAAGAAVDFAFSGTSAQLTALMDSWVVSMPGFVLQTSTPPPVSGNGRMVWRTREFTIGGSFAPELIVDFAPVVPEPSILFLFGAGGLLLWRRCGRK